jgi:hypothetical protein
MFSNSERDMQETLAKLHRHTLDRCNGNQVEAQQKMTELVQQDRRFDGYQPDRLVSRVQECWGHGAKLDLEDPSLLKKPRNRYA